MKIYYEWENDSEGNDILVLTKKRGKFKVSEIEEFLKYDFRSYSDFYIKFSGRDETFEPSGFQESENKGDTVILHEIKNYED